MKLPVVFKLLLPLIAGILSGFFLHLQVPYWLVCVLAVLLVLPVIPPINQYALARQSVVLLAFPFFFTLGVFLEDHADSRKSSLYYNHLSDPDTLNYYHLRIEQSPVLKANWVKCEVHVEGTNHQSSAGKAIVYIARDSIAEQLRYGDQLYVSTDFFDVPDPANPHEFNYKAYLRIHDIHQQAFVRSGNWKKTGNDANPFLEFIYNTRNRCNRLIENSGMSPENAGVAKALIIGDKEWIEDELMLSYAASGTLHALAVSGLHVGIVMLILSFIFSPVKRLKKGKIIFLVIALSGIWFYSIITGLSPSVLRAAVMFSFVIIGSEMQRDNSIYQSLLVSALLLILIDPHIIFKIGFLLSYLAVFGIVFLHPKIFALLHFNHFIVHKTWEITSVSIAAQIATFPLGIYCFQQFPNFFLIANLVVIPLSFFILVVGLAYLVTATIPLLGDALLWLMDCSITILNISVRWVEELPGSVLYGITIQWYDVLILYGFIFSMVYALMWRSKRLLLLSCSLVFATVLFNVIEKSAVHDQNHVVFYAVKNELAVDVFYGQELESIMSAGLMQNERSKRFHIFPNRYAISGTSEPEKELEFTTGNNVLTVGERHLLFVTQHILDSVYQETFPLTDFLYLHQVHFLNNTIVNSLKDGGTKIILGYGVPPRLKNYLTARLGSARLYDLPACGALVARF
jgi:competence protein ComEC